MMQDLKNAAQIPVLAAQAFVALFRQFPGRMAMITLATLALPALAAVQLLASEEKYDFRKVRWGMTKAEVEKSETEAVKRGGKYFTKMFGMEVEVRYEFNKFDRVISGMYLFPDSSVPMLARDVRRALYQKYGPSDDEKSPAPDKLDDSIMLMWKSGSSNIRLVFMVGDLAIGYSCTNRYIFDRSTPASEDDKKKL